MLRSHPHIVLCCALLARQAAAQPPPSAAGPPAESAQPAPSGNAPAPTGAAPTGHAQPEPTGPSDAPPSPYDPAQPVEVIVIGPVDTRTGKPGDLDSPESEHGARARGLGRSGFTTAVRVDELAAEMVPLAEALAETVGVHVRSLGGLGGFSSISVRGAPTAHTAVFIDGVPLARLGSASTDLGRFDLGSFSLVELHRGALPAALGGATQASALHLTTELGPALDGHPLLLAIGGGSFGTRHLRARWLGGGETHGHHLGLSYSGSEGDFTYFNDNGTNLEPSDDRYVTRSNNGFDRVDAVARAGGRLAGWSLSGGARGGWKRQGVPGTASVQSQTASLTTWSQMADGAAERTGAFGSQAMTARAGAHALVEIDRYRDPRGEIGLSVQNRRYITIAAGASGGLVAELSPAHSTSASVEVGAESFADRDMRAASAGDPAARSRGLRLDIATVLAHAVRLRGATGERARIEPAVRLDLARTTPIADPQDGVAGADLSPRVDFHVTPRVALWLRVGPDLSLKSSVGRYRRAPTTVELYGDRGAIVGNPDLRPETGESADLGLVWAPAAPAGPIDRVYVEAAGFASRSRDTIVWFPGAGVVRPHNQGAARLWGGELVASARAARAVTVTGDYTYLGSRQRDTLPSYEGKELPQRPRHQLHGRADVAGRLGERLAVVYGDAALVSGNHLDPANLNRVPPRALLGAGIKLEIAPRLLAGLEGKNLTDSRVEDIQLDPPPRPDLTSAPRAVADFFGYPLPGRAFYVTLQWEP